MLQTIQGYFREGNFVPLQQAKIPNNVEVFVVITDNPVLADEPVNLNDKIEGFPLFNCAKGKGGWIADDFDAPLEEMAEYM
ncbi:MAG: DUF2281 domain-containing protein [Firmicutes bacterium]|nr:DUF2281 domain-containing protein [Bacillota bacterium]